MAEGFCLTGGQVYNFERRCFEPARVVVSENHAVIEKASAAAHSADAPEGWKAVDVSGCSILPGLTDFHTHVGRGGGLLPYDPDQFCPETGVSEVQDGGTYGTDDFDRFAKETAAESKIRIHALLHVAREGQMHPEAFENQRPERIDEILLRDYCEKYSGLITGFKIRLESVMFEEHYAAAAVEKACGIASLLPGSRRVMVHLGRISDMEQLRDVISVLRPGDIVTHIYQPGVSGFSSPGGIYEELRRAQERGVLLDTGFGSRQWSYRTIENAQISGVIPDTVSSDCNQTNIILPVPVSIQYAAAVLRSAGMTEDDLIWRLCANAQRCLNGVKTEELYDRGDLFVFRKADAALEMKDMTGAEKRLEQKILPVLTVVRGNIVYRAH